MHPTLGLDPAVEAGRLVAIYLVGQGRALASAGLLDSAITIFQRAKELNPDPDLDPSMEVGRIEALQLGGLGRELASEGLLDSAIVVFVRAKELRPDLDLSEEGRSITQYLLQRGNDAVQNGDVEQAIASFERAVLLDSAQINPSDWNALLR